MFAFPQVLARLKSVYGDLYTERNVMLSGSHTHSTPGGFMQDLLFDLSILGFVRQTFVALTIGIVKVSRILSQQRVQRVLEEKRGTVTVFWFQSHKMTHYRHG
jgi:hypothetical protein